MTSYMTSHFQYKIQYKYSFSTKLDLTILASFFPIQAVFVVGEPHLSVCLSIYIYILASASLWLAYCCRLMLYLQQTPEPEPPLKGFYGIVFALVSMSSGGVCTYILIHMPYCPKSHRLNILLSLTRRVALVKVQIIFIGPL